MVIKPKYIFHLTLDKAGNIIPSDSPVGPLPQVDDNEKPLSFSDFFSSSEWTKYKKQRTKAWENAQKSFVIDLQKINYPDQTSTLSKWEFFFTANDDETCLGIGHPINRNQSIESDFIEFFDSSIDNEKLINSILEEKVLGFWEFNPEESKNSISQELAHALGYTQNEPSKTVAVPVEKLIFPEDHEALKGTLSSYFKSNGNLPFKAEFRVVSKNEKNQWVYCFGKTIDFNQEGNPIKILGCILDIDYRKNQEMWMYEHQHFLKDHVFNQSHAQRAKLANISGLLELVDLEQNKSDIKKIIKLIKNETQILDSIIRENIKKSVDQKITLLKNKVKD